MICLSTDHAHVQSFVALASWPRMLAAIWEVESEALWVSIPSECVETLEQLGHPGAFGTFASFTRSFSSAFALSFPFALASTFATSAGSFPTSTFIVVFPVRTLLAFLVSFELA